MVVRVGGRFEKESPLHGSQASEQASGPAQGSAPPVDKRSILSISLSAPDNKQKFSKPRSCLSFEMCILLRCTHAVAQLHSHTDGIRRITLILFKDQSVGYEEDLVEEMETILTSYVYITKYMKQIGSKLTPGNTSISPPCYNMLLQ